jgi:hypothetical protein
MSNKIIDVDKTDGGILVSFADGVTSFFDADFLYTRLEKRLDPFPESDSTSTP